MLQIRKANPEDLRQIMPLYEKAREFMEKNGNPTQWGKNNPPEDLIRKDIEEGYLYVGEAEEIALVFHFHVGEEPNYKEIYEGAWHRNEAYGVIHRVVSSGKFPVLPSYAFSFVRNSIPTLGLIPMRIIRSCKGPFSVSDFNIVERLS